MHLTEKRLQVYLPEQDYRAIKRRAQKEGKSVAQVIREAAALYLTKGSQTTQAEGLRKLLGGAGVCRDDRGDVSERHDDYLGEKRW